MVKATDCNSVSVGSTPIMSLCTSGEMEDTPDLGSDAERHEGSSPSSCTKYIGDMPGKEDKYV